MQLIMQSLIVLASITVTSCSWGQRPEPVIHYMPVVVKLPLPPPPVLPAIEASHISCLTDDAVRAILKRDKLRRDYADQLEIVINSTHINTEQNK